MAINRVEIKDFLVFKGDFAMDFCPGVNVLIGSNGTGKTTLLKVLYWATEFANKSLLDKDKLQLNRTANDLYIIPFFLWDYFGGRNELYNDKDDSDFISTICVSRSAASDEILPELKVKVSKNLNKIQINIVDPSQINAFNLLAWCNKKISSTFIPAAEMLSHSRGFLALNRERPIPFDKTEVDIISKAELEPTREITHNAKIVLKKLSSEIDGIVLFDGKDFYVEKTNGDKVLFSFEASGFRKLGLLWKLLRNGLLESDTILFWDEPENSLNPELVPVLVDILLELAKNGVQIFVATHDYNVARYFDARKDRSVLVKFHNLMKTATGIECASAAKYLEVPNNLLEKASEDLFDAVVDSAMEGHGDEI
ncbi:MAG: AAA family ATPase [Gracilibacteraceae bacterium]|jgi:AAA15 family ATPase/GTPase|nr:AAA family ATPase [Gracilibacteraceae bacterium]